MDGYMKVYGRDWNNIDVEDWQAYSTAVRKLSEITYREHRWHINPLNLKRGVRTYHLDHKVPIIECFKRGWSPEQAASVNNLQILRAEDNLSKSRSLHT